MAKLRCESLAERSLIPAFIFFFQMLYPFAWVNRRERIAGGAAGGCMLVRPDALDAGGIEGIRSSLIDDCALGRAMKGQRPDLARAHGAACTACARIRGFGDIGRMVARSAYAQLAIRRCCWPARLRHGARLHRAGAAGAVCARRSAGCSALSRGVLMALALQPTLRFYRLVACLGVWRCRPSRLALVVLHAASPPSACARPRRGWKGRVQADAPGACHDAVPRDSDPARGTRDENFPVASWLIRRRHRPPILAF